MRRAAPDRWIAHAVGMLALLAASGAAGAAPRNVLLTVTSPRDGPALALTGEPESTFVCRVRRDQRICTARVPRVALRLRARTLAPPGSASASALSIPIDGRQWRGDCAGTPADVCRLTMTRDRVVHIDSRDR